MVLVIVAGLGLGAGLGVVLWGLFPPPLTLRAALGRLTGEHTPAATDVLDPWGGRGSADVPGRW